MKMTFTPPIMTRWSPAWSSDGSLGHTVGGGGSSVNPAISSGDY